jgi:hypothetical protein
MSINASSEMQRARVNERWRKPGARTSPQPRRTKVHAKLSAVQVAAIAEVFGSGEGFEVEMVMERATGIVACPAHGTHGLAIQVLTNRQLGPTCAAEHRLLVEFSLKPNLGGMPGFQLVAVKAGIIGQAAFEFYREFNWNVIVIRLYAQNWVKDRGLK